MKITPRVVGAVLGAVAAVGLAGVGWAAAQESPSTTSPPSTSAPPSTQSPDNGQGRHCDHDRGTSDSPSNTDAPAGDQIQL